MSSPTAMLAATHLPRVAASILAGGKGVFCGSSTVGGGWAPDAGAAATSASRAMLARSKKVMSCGGPDGTRAAPCPAVATPDAAFKQIAFCVRDLTDELHYAIFWTSIRKGRHDCFPLAQGVGWPRGRLRRRRGRPRA